MCTLISVVKCKCDTMCGSRKFCQRGPNLIKKIVDEGTEDSITTIN